MEPATNSGTQPTSFYQERGWEVFFSKLERNIMNPAEKMDLLAQTQIELSSGSLKATDEVELKLRSVGFLLLKDPQEIEAVQNGIETPNQNLKLAMTKANSKGGLLVSFEKYFSIIRKEYKNEETNKSFWFYFCTNMKNCSFSDDGLLEAANLGLESGTLTIDEGISIELQEIGYVISSDRKII